MRGLKQIKPTPADPRPSDRPRAGQTGLIVSIASMPTYNQRIRHPLIPLVKATGIATTLPAQCGNTNCRIAGTED